jgi:type IV pilus biogenesis protein CpaD/CtpE
LRVKSSAILILVLVASLTAGCRQPDGPIPSPDEENANRIGDIGRDLEAVARGESGATQGLADDLAVFADDHSEDEKEVVRAFARRLGDAVVNAKLTEQTAQQIAQTSWRLVGVTELSDRQVRALQDELRGQLVAVGVSESQADVVIAEMPAVQRAVTTRPRRWYEIF